MTTRTRTALLAALCLLAAAQAHAQKKKGEESPQPRQIEFTEFDLENGLHVILHEDHANPLVTVGVMYEVGAKDDPRHMTGAAHFVEHLMFEGSENIERGEFSRIVENAGGTLNANTSYDRTYYYEIMPSNQVELGLWLESERMLHATLSQEEKGLEVQRGVVGEERRQTSENESYGMILEETMSRVFKQFNYKDPILGSMEHIQSATGEDLFDYYQTYYVPNNAVLCVAGDIDSEEVKAMVEKYFSGIPRGEQEIERVEYVKPDVTYEVRDYVYDGNVQLPAVVMAYRIPVPTHEDFYAMQMVSTLLSNGRSSRMYKKIVDKEQKALFAGAFPLGLESQSVFLGFAICNLGVQPAEVETLMNEEIERVKTELVDEEEFQKLVNQQESDIVQGNSQIAGIASSLCTYHMFRGGAENINTELERMMAVKREDLQRVAKKYLNDENRVVLYYLPKPAN